MSYGLIDSRFTKKYNLKRILICPKAIVRFNTMSKEGVKEIVIVRLDINGYVEERAFLYVVSRLASYNIILGRP